MPGTPGTPGLPGTNGRDGDQGVEGHRGPVGPQGERGLPGPRGREGEDGRHGEAGSPGVCAWLAKGGCSKEERLLLPPRISNSGMGGVRPVILREKENLQLTCATSGDPRPTVTWSRKDGWAVIDGPYKRGQYRGWRWDITLEILTCHYPASYVPSPVLNITHINRAHMGTYVCEAFNGIPPNDTQEFRVDVYCECKPVSCPPLAPHCCSSQFPRPSWWRRQWWEATRARPSRWSAGWSPGLEPSSEYLLPS